MMPNPLDRTFDEDKHRAQETVVRFISYYYALNILLFFLLGIFYVYALFFIDTIYIMGTIHLIIRTILLSCVISDKGSTKLMHILLLLADIFFAAFLFSDRLVFTVICVCLFFDTISLLYYAFSKTFLYDTYASIYWIINPFLKNKYDPLISDEMRRDIILNDRCVDFYALLYHMIETRVIEYSSKPYCKKHPNIMRSIVLYNAYFYVAILALDKKYISSVFYSDGKKHKPDAKQYRDRLRSMRAQLLKANGWNYKLSGFDIAVSSELSSYIKVCLDNNDTNISAIENFAYNKVFRIVDIDSVDMAGELTNFYNYLYDPLSFDNYYYEYIDTIPVVYSGLPSYIQDRSKYLQYLEQLNNKANAKKQINRSADGEVWAVKQSDLNSPQFKQVVEQYNLFYDYLKEQNDRINEGENIANKPKTINIDGVECNIQELIDETDYDELQMILDEYKKEVEYEEYLASYEAAPSNSENDTAFSSASCSNNTPNIVNRLFCSKCGVHLPADAVFCHKCGSKVYKG